MVSMGAEAVAFVRFLLIGISLLLTFFAVITWNRRKDAPGAGPCAILIACMAVYAFGYSGEVAATTLEGARRWLDVEHLVLPWAPALWLMTACQHNGRQIRSWMLFVIPVISFVDHYANFFHSFYTGPMTLVAHPPFWVLEIPRGPVSMLDNAYLLVAFAGGAWLYLSALRNASALFRRQAMVLVLTSQLPITGYFIYLVGWSPYGLDITPFAMGVSCMLFYYGFFRCGIYDLAPLGRTLIFNSMRDAVLILDTKDRVLDFNPAAQALVPALTKGNLGGEIYKLVEDNPSLLQALTKTYESAEFSVMREDGIASFQIRTWPLVSGTKQVGRALIFADVTAQVLLREELRLRADTDPLTGLANRRRFHYALEMECIRFSRMHSPVSLMMIDLDFFKEINDRYGHPAGDAVLRSIAAVLIESTRKTDLVARYGGEEFAVLLPETSYDGAMVIADRIRVAVMQQAVDLDGVTIRLTTSIGVTSYGVEPPVPPSMAEPDPKMLLKEADTALYKAKTGGRNRVEFFTRPVSAGGFLPGETSHSIQQPQAMGITVD